MSTPEALVIIGAGGHGREILDIVEAMNRRSPTYQFLGFIDDGPVDGQLLEQRNAPLLGGVQHLRNLNVRYLVGIGAPHVRRKIDEYASSLNLEPGCAVHPEATMGSDVGVSPGLVMAAGARVTTNIRLGRHVHLNVNCTVSHDCVLGDYVIMNPGSSVCGNVVLESEVVIGTGATVIQGRRIGFATVIGAGAAVVSDLPEKLTAVGIPARPVARA